MLSPFATALLAAVLIGNTAGQLLFKAAALKATAPEETATYWQQLVTQPTLWMGLALYVVEFFIWLAFLSSVPLWQGVMVASIDIIAVMIAGRIFFGEQITPARFSAVALITVGALLVGWGGGSE